VRLFLTLLLIVCGAAPGRASEGAPPTVSRQLPKMLDGDIFFLYDRTVHSAFVCSLDNESGFCHVGIIKFIDGVPHVITAIPEIKGYDGGRVVCEPFAKVFENPFLERWAVFRVRETTPAVRERAVLSALMWAIEKRPFDMAFDLADQSKLYCTELVWRAYQDAGVSLAKESDLRTIPMASKRVIVPATLLESDALELVGASFAPDPAFFVRYHVTSTPPTASVQTP